MPQAKDPTLAMRKTAAAYAGVTQGTSCNQTSFKAGKTAFLYVGPGAKGQGFKAMFKLERSMPQAKTLAGKEPQRFEVGSTAWVATRFTAEEPLPKTIWQEWLKESYELATKNVKMKVTKKKTKTPKKKAGAKGPAKRR